MDATSTAVTTAGAPASGSRTPSIAGRRLARGAQYVVAALSIAAVIVGASLFDVDGAVFVWQGTWLVRELVPGTVTCAVVGLVILRRLQAAAVGWTMLAFAMAWGLSVLLAGLYVQSFSSAWTVSSEFFVASLFFLGIGWLLGTTLLPQVFPTGWLSGWPWRVLLLMTMVAEVAVLVLEALVSWADSTSADAPIDLEITRWLSRLVWFASFFVVLAVLAERVRRGPRLVRQQIGPFAIAWLLTVAANTVRWTEYEYNDSSWAYLMVWLWPVITGLVILATATQVGLWDSRLVVRRFAVYTIVVGALTVVFAGVYFAVLLVLSSGAVDDRYRWLALLIAAVAVIAADPLRRRLRTALERRLLGERSEPLRPLGRLDALPSVADADDEQVQRTIVETVGEAVRAPGVALALHQAPDIEVVATTGVIDDHPVVLSLLHRGERLGELRVAPRTPGEAYGRTDRALLDRLAGQVAAVVYGLRRDTDIADLRSESIEALVEQRMALGRDLHDGIAPLLAGAGLTADALRRGMPTDSPDAEDAARLSARLRAAASEVRRISHDLQPNPGGPHLPAVITDYVDSVSGPAAPVFTVRLDDRATAAMSATAELTLSRVALEAITNVVRHAHATRAEVSLRRDGADLVLRVSDNGRGIAQPYVSGLGITSMRSRVQALGGTFDLTPGPDNGTVIMVRVPVP